MTNINHNAKRLKLMGIKSNRKCPGYCEESNGYYNQTVTELEYDLFFWRKNLLHLLKSFFQVRIKQFMVQQLYSMPSLFMYSIKDNSANLILWYIHVSILYIQWYMSIYVCVFVFLWDIWNVKQHNPKLIYHI